MPINLGLKHYLKQGGIIAYATDSCFGLGCDRQSRLGLQRILRIKGRPQHKGVLIIAANQKQQSPYIAKLNPLQNNTLNSTWNNATTKSKSHTWLIPTAHNCPPWLTSRFNSIAARVTKYKLSAKLCHSLNMALLSTSTNKSGGKPAKTSKDCHRLFGHQVRVIDGLIGKEKRPSTIQDLLSSKLIRA